MAAVVEKEHAYIPPHKPRQFYTFGMNEGERRALRLPDKSTKKTDSLRIRGGCGSGMYADLAP